MGTFLGYVGTALDAAREDYDAKILAEYRQKSTETMHVLVHSSFKAPEWQQLDNIITLPTGGYALEPGLGTLRDVLEVACAHELFHAYQDIVWDKPSGAMHEVRNDWAIEALAELAAYELAFPEKNRERPIRQPGYSLVPYDYLIPGEKESHQYDMSCYLDYLLDKCNTTFAEMWEYLAVNGNAVPVEYALNDFLRSKSSDFASIETSYTGFWRDVVTDSDAPVHSALAFLFHESTTMETPRIARAKANEHRFSFSYSAAADYTTALNLFGIKEFAPGSAVRIFIADILPAQDGTGPKGSAYMTSISGISLSELSDPLWTKELPTARVNGGRSWDYLFPRAGEYEPTYFVYEFREGSDDALLVALGGEYKGGLAQVNLTEIQAQALPGKLDDAVVGEEYEFAFAFEGIPKCITEFKCVVDWGDGTTAEYYPTTATGQLSGSIKHKFLRTADGPVTCSLYDVTQAAPRLVAQASTSVIFKQDLTLRISPSSVAPGERVVLVASIDNPTHSYSWDYGDGANESAVGSSETEHSYGEAGSYTATVTVHDEAGELLGTANATVTVDASSTTMPSPAPTIASPYTQLNGTWTGSMTFYGLDGEVDYDRPAVPVTLDIVALDDGSCSVSYRIDTSSIEALTVDPLGSGVARGNWKYLGPAGAVATYEGSIRVEGTDAGTLMLGSEGWEYQVFWELGFGDYDPDVLGVSYNFLAREQVEVYQDICTAAATGSVHR